MTPSPYRELFREADPATAVTPAALRRVELALGAQRSRPAHAVRWGRVALAAPLILGAQIGLAAVMRNVIARSAPSIPETSLAAQVRLPAPVPRQDPVAPSPPTPEHSVRPAPLATRTPRPPAPRLSDAVTPTTGGAAPESSLQVETRLLAEALSALRDRSDPAGALRTLDHYAARFPSGALVDEAALTRVDALLALGRPDEALPWLERLEQRPDVPRARELRVLHGELLAQKGLCDAALPYFSAEGLPPALAERAVYGRALCRRAQGDVAGSREDLTRYLAAFPNGRFAPAVRRALGL